MTVFVAKILLKVVKQLFHYLLTNFINYSMGCQQPFLSKKIVREIKEIREFREIRENREIRVEWLISHLSSLISHLSSLIFPLSSYSLQIIFSAIAR